MKCRECLYQSRNNRCLHNRLDICLEVAYQQEKKINMWFLATLVFSLYMFQQRHLVHASKVKCKVVFQQISKSLHFCLFSLRIFVILVLMYGFFNSKFNFIFFFWAMAQPAFLNFGLSACVLQQNVLCRYAVCYNTLQQNTLCIKYMYTTCVT